MVLIFLCFALGWGTNLFAQAMPGNEVPLSTVLKDLSNRYQVTFSYNVGLMKGLRVTPPSNDRDLRAALDNLSTQVPVRFSLSNDSNYAIIPIRSPLLFQVTDAADSKPIDLIYITINGSKQRYLIPQSGSFRLENSFPSDSLQITTSFYTPVQTTAAQIKQGGGMVRLNQDTVNLGEVTILSYLTSGVNSFLGDHHVEINMNDLGLIAGETDGDVLQVLQAIPGIRSPNGKPGSLNFRGSPFGLNLTLFDDIPIYHNGHFFGTFSPYNPAIVENIAVYRGTLPSKWGGRVGGLINVRTSDKVPERMKTSITANTVLGGVEFEAPITSRLGILFSARANYPFNKLSPKLQAYADLNFQGSRLSARLASGNGSFFEDLDIRFSDISGKIIYDINEDHKLTFSYLNIQNSLYYDFQTPRQNRREVESNKQDNYGLTTAWAAKWSDKFSSRLSFTNSSYNIFEDKADRQDGNQNDGTTENIVTDNRFKALLDYISNLHTTWTFGYELADQKAIYEVSQTTGQEADLERKNNETQTQGIFVSLEKEINARFIINAGLRTDLYSENQTSFLDPRFSFTYLASQSLFFKAAASRSHQYVTQQFGNDFDDFRVGNQFWSLAERNAHIVEGIQLMAGALYDKADWLIDLEIYTNNIENITRPGPLLEGQEPLPEMPGELSTIGADLLIKKRWPGFETWLSYTLGRTEDHFINTTQPTYYDQRHALNIKWLYPMGRWDFALSWGLMSGLPVYLPIPEEIESDERIDFGYENRFPTQHQMDLSATYRFSPADAKWKGVLGFSVLNLYDQNNIINIFQSNVKANDYLRRGVGFAPNLQVRITF